MEPRMLLEGADEEESSHCGEHHCPPRCVSRDPAVLLIDFSPTEEC